MLEMTEITEQVITTVTETYEEFIFETIYPWIQEKTQLKISKRILERALLEYRANHTEEFKPKDKTGLDKMIEDNDDEEI